MKKIIFFAFLVCGGYVFGQDTVKIEGYPTTSTTTNSHYITVYTETPAKAARKFYAENAFPFIYSGGIVRPRSISTNLVVGSTTNPYGDKLYVNGLFRTSGNAYFGDHIYFGTNGLGTHIYSNPITGELSFYCPVAGASYTLSQLAQGGSDTTGTSLFDSVSTTYYPKLTAQNWNFGGIYPSPYKVTVTGSLRSTGEAHFGAVNYDTYIYGSLKIPNYSLLIGDTYRFGLSSGIAGLRIYDGNTSSRYLYIKPTSTAITIYDNEDNGFGITNSTTDYLTLTANNSPYYYNGTYFYNGTDSLATRAYARSVISAGEILVDATLDAAPDTFVTINNGNWGYTTSGVGGGVVDSTSHSVGQLAIWTSQGAIGGYSGLRLKNDKFIINSISEETGTGALTGINVGSGGNGLIGIGQNTVNYNEDSIAAWHTRNNSDMISAGGIFYGRYGVVSIGDLGVWNGEEQVFKVDGDSTYLMKFTGDANTWLTLTSTGAFDTAHTGNSWIGLEMDLPTLKEYFADQKIVNGHKELRIYYLDKSGNLKSKYGWAGLGVMETQSAYAIFHEITMRYLVEQGKRISELENGKRAVLKRKVNNLEERLDTLEKLIR